MTCRPIAQRQAPPLVPLLSQLPNVGIFLYLRVPQHLGAVPRHDEFCCENWEAALILGWKPDAPFRRVHPLSVKISRESWVTYFCQDDKQKRDVPCDKCCH